MEDFTVSGDSVYYSTFDGEFYQWTPGGEAKELDIEPFTTETCRRLLQADHQGNLTSQFLPYETAADGERRWRLPRASIQAGSQ